jgi:ryanodine receptor 2
LQKFSNNLCQHAAATKFFLLYYSFLSLFLQTFETKKKGVGKVEEKQAVLHEEGKMDDGLEFSRSQEEESRTARVIRKCSSLFTRFIKYEIPFLPYTALLLS